MKLLRKQELHDPVMQPLGAKIYEMIGHPEAQGKATKQSVAYVIVPRNKATMRIYCNVTEET